VHLVGFYFKNMNYCDTRLFCTDNISRIHEVPRELDVAQGTSLHHKFLQFSLLPKPSAAGEANRWADPRSLAANEGLELGDSS
jgi:hypothetical protein